MSRSATTTPAPHRPDRAQQGKHSSALGSSLAEAMRAAFGPMPALAAQDVVVLPGLLPTDETMAQMRQAARLSGHTLTWAMGAGTGITWYVRSIHETTPKRLLLRRIGSVS